MPVPWAVRWEPAARKALRDLPPHEVERIVHAVAALAEDPYAARNVKAMQGGGYRMRVGDRRVIYALREAELVVLVVRIGNRGQVYR